MQSRLLKGFSLVELCFAIIILGISISAVLPISKVALSAKNSQESLQALVAQKQILATRLKERSGGIGKDSEFCDKYGFGCFDKSPKAPQIQSDTLNLTLPVAPKNFTWQKI
ncbi:type II secretion system protein [Campylobacter sp. 19-13652]|uniref:type II secretion system protein n=1 Tax=Campylobacter sp. 19-13652 TaxID=2840180 RepID=UPI001C7977FB|nr:type II secretion system protein [Campylobacter sp. 19-13652]BCX79642.1 hypothetical protein LBC_11040 [Campylobacter sp. 19-13652]